jgi:GH15 family glucan-1,4-alpha-glucosidase
VASLGSIAAGLKSCSTWEEISTDSRNNAGRVANEIQELIRTQGLFEGRLAKWIGGQGLDSSLLSLIAPFHLINGKDQITRLTIASVSQELGMFGTFRHKEDGYFGGGRWPLLSCFLGLTLIESGENEKALEILNWVETLANENLELPEQLEGPLLFPEMRAEWIQSWGEPAVPLLWSHAMYLSLYASLHQSAGKE